MGARGSLVVAAVVVVGALGARPAQAWCRMTTSLRDAAPGECVTDGVPLEWRRRCIEYAIDARGSRDMTLDQVTDIVHESFGAWLAVECDGVAPGFEVRESSRNSMCGKAQYNTDGGNVNTVAFVPDWEEREYDPRAYALTTVWHNTSTGAIYDADIEINESDKTYGICPPVDGCTDGTIDLQNVLTHEVGHFFGLAHSDQVAASMYWTAMPGDVDKRILRTDDVDGLCSIYPPGSLPDECSFTPRHGLALDCEEEDGCGCTAPGAPRDAKSWLALPLVALALLVRRRRTGR